MPRAGARSPAARGVVNVSKRGRRWKGARRGGEDGQLFSDKEAREVRFEHEPAQITGAGLVEPRE